jgi:DNA-binding NarL/FixJ family response regulator
VAAERRILTCGFLPRLLFSGPAQTVGVTLYGVVLFVTANAMSHQRQAYRMAGMDALVSKPIRVSELAMAIQRAIGPRG